MLTAVMNLQSQTFFHGINISPYHIAINVLIFHCCFVQDDQSTQMHIDSFAVSSIFVVFVVQSVPYIVLYQYLFCIILFLAL